MKNQSISRRDSLKKICKISGGILAADAQGALLFGKKPEDIGFIKLGDKWGLGTMDLTKVKQHSVVL